ncbi:hypothetical protein ACIBG8_41300 [Nonomuraea sp. NPDC050556]|uniref:hypothetical protein n=1 Tax=Nonomuraea sp. NPDC050556 TaxID=3364369 RepID=UPI0037A746AF
MRLLLPLILLGMAIFLYGQAPAAPFAGEDVQVVEGVAEAYRTYIDSPGEGSRRTTRVVYEVTMAEHPYALRAAPSGGIAKGDRVRLETVGAKVVGATVNGQVLYSASDDLARASSRATFYTVGALGCFLAAVAWGGFVAWRHRTRIKELLP